jgi:hypothetical protein
MNQPTKQFADLIVLMCAQYDKEATEARILSYWMCLDDLPLKDVALAIRQAMREREFLPTAKSIRDIAQGCPEDIAELAFVSLSNNVRSYVSVDFEDRCINATVRHLGGMLRLCDMPATEFDTWFRKKFMKVYAMYQRRGVGEEEGRYLVGLFEADRQCVMSPEHSPPERLTVPAAYAIPAQLESQSQTLLEKP